MREVKGVFLIELGQLWHLYRIQPDAVQEFMQLIDYCLYLLNGFKNEAFNIKDLPNSVIDAGHIVTNLERLKTEVDTTIIANILTGITAVR